MVHQNGIIQFLANTLTSTVVLYLKLQISKKNSFVPILMMN